ncbi:YeeE/YedE family protein [Planktotalea sp.]|uniref:YeeE/YedE family protein n=1 Tax=Planktotalea sp. TaxID=2029877 RepID=UPI0025F51054|nr:YeeE/YedE family protein [Planktotalea sp.]
MEFLSSDTTLVALFGALGGIALGLAARLGRFCTLGAIEDALYGGSTERLRMWFWAIGIAVLGTFTLLGFGVFEATESFYLSRPFSLVASVLGGLTFGYGMALAGNCGFGAIARLGGGDLRSFVIILVMGITSYSVLSGPFAMIRVWAFPSGQAVENPAGIAHGLSTLTGLSPIYIGLAVGILICLAALLRGPLTSAPKSLFWATIVGLAIVSGWAGSAWIAHTGFDDVSVISHTFSAPIGETILYTMLSSGIGLSFGVGSVAGVWIGAFIGSLIKGHFRWEACEDPRELRRQILGAVLMGIGAIIATGCTIGQGISAFSLLSYSAPVTLLAIFAGCALGLKQLIEGFTFLSKNRV